MSNKQNDEYIEQLVEAERDRTDLRARIDELEQFKGCSSGTKSYREFSEAVYQHISERLDLLKKELREYV